MKFNNALVTGGAGFIGSFIVDELIKKGYSVKILDNLEEQVHQNKIPEYMNKNAEFFKGDVRDIETLRKAIEDVDIIFHEAAAVGIGQSQYQIKKYVETNTLGTANLLDILANSKHNVKKLIVPSSNTIYGEGSYLCEGCGKVSPPLRTKADTKNKDWELKCPNCKKNLKPLNTREDKKQDPNSIYAITKMDQERLCMNIGNTYGIPTVILRYFNVYGPRQSLNNPYTGVSAIFISRIKNDHPPIIYEDGLQTRDFISIYDIVNANILAMERFSANYEIFNVGSGKQTTIKHLSEVLTHLLKKNLKPIITNEFRKGDIRHCFADITKIKEKLDFEQHISFEEGMMGLIKWSESQKAEDQSNKANLELKNKGLI